MSWHPYRRGSLWVVLPAVALATLAGYAFLLEPHWLEVRRIDIPCAAIHRGPVRIALFADMDHGSGRGRERQVQLLARAFRPDLVLVAGDLLEQRAARDPRAARAAGDYLRSIPAAHGHFLAPGEAETPSLRSLRRVWGPLGIEALANQATRIEVRGDRLDVFVGDLRLDPAPWGLGRDADHSFAASRGRPVPQELLYRGPERGPERGPARIDWSDAEVSLAFQAVERQSFVDVRLAWEPNARVPERGSGWRIVRHEERPAFRLAVGHTGEKKIEGRRRSSFDPPAGVWCRARIRTEDDGRTTHVRARFWRESDPEPPDWAIDAQDRSPGRRLDGTLSFGGLAGERRIADVRVVSRDRVVVLERFDDLPRFLATWAYPSRLADWVYEGERDTARLVLAHTPDVALDLDAIAGEPPCLVMAGHTHGGQIQIPFFGPLFTPTHLDRGHADGFSFYRGIPLYVTRGVGTSVIPARFLARPELTLITLRPASYPVRSPARAQRPRARTQRPRE